MFIKILDENIRFEHATPGSAGYDMFARLPNPVMVRPMEAVLIPTGIRMHIGDPSVAFILIPRSGLGHKKGMVLGNLVGLIDSDYQGEIMASVWNRNPDKDLWINPYDPVCQGMFVSLPQPKVEVLPPDVEFTEVTSRGWGSFGSTLNIFEDGKNGKA